MERYETHVSRNEPGGASCPALVALVREPERPMIHLMSTLSEALVLREVEDGIWRDFSRDVEKSALAARQPVFSHWRRALALGASLEGPPAEDHLLRGEALKPHVERTELVLDLAAADLERAASDVSPRAYVLLMADASGVVVNAIGGGHFQDEARRVRLIPGASWSEAARGTNAIGTAIAERRPVFVRGNAHLGRRFHELVCYAAPIFDADGSLLAVLDATSGLACADDAVGGGVLRTAAAIMRVLRDRAFGAAGASVRRTLARALERMAGIALLVEPPGRVTRMNAGARALLGARASTPEALLGVALSALLREGHAPEGLYLERAGRRYVVRVDPIQAPRDRDIAALVFLEPVEAQRPAPPRQVATQAGAFGRVFSRDAELDAALALARRVADSALPVSLLAETGAGKELVARAIHEASPRASGPFVAVNCAAIAPSLLESELFGYAPAAFTGAERGGRHGLFAAASGGTIFLDEVAEMPPAMQAALLRVLEDGTYRRVGETTLQRADVRVVSATCRDLSELVEACGFRRDLFYRLRGAVVRLPPLRARSDRAALAEHLLASLSQHRGIARVPGLSSEVLALIERHDWPGNVRELHTVLDVSLILAGDSPRIELEHLPPEFRREVAARERASLSQDPSERKADLASLEAAAVRRVLAEVDGNVSLAAKRLGIARSTLYRMLRRGES